MTRYGVHAGTEGASIEQVLAYWRDVEWLGFGWISAWDHFYPIMGRGGAGSFEAVATPRNVFVFTRSTNPAVAASC